MLLCRYNMLYHAGHERFIQEKGACAGGQQVACAVHQNEEHRVRHAQALGQGGLRAFGRAGKRYRLHQGACGSRHRRSGNQQDSLGIFAIRCEYGKTPEDISNFLRGVFALKRLLAAFITVRSLLFRRVLSRCTCSLYHSGNECSIRLTFGNDLRKQRKDVAFDRLVAEGQQAALPLSHVGDMIAARLDNRRDLRIGHIRFKFRAVIALQRQLSVYDLHIGSLSFLSWTSIASWNLPHSCGGFAPFAKLGNHIPEGYRLLLMVLLP